LFHLEFLSLSFFHLHPGQQEKITDNNEGRRGQCFLHHTMPIMIGNLAYSSGSVNERRFCPFMPPPEKGLTGNQGNRIIF
jgi:hypothetical protein